MQVDPSRISIQEYRGGLAVLGPALLDAQQLYSRDLKPPSFPLHITLMTSCEYKECRKPQPPQITFDHVYVIGRDGNKDGSVQWLNVVWNHADVWRKSMGLGKKEYHVTLTDHDDHSLSKGIRELLYKESEVCDLLKRLEDLGEAGMDHTSLASPPSLALQITERMILLYPSSHKGYIRLGETCIDHNPKLACLCFARALSLSPSLGPTIIKRLKSLREVTSFGPVLTKDESDHIPHPLRKHLVFPFPDLPTFFIPHTTESRHRAVFREQELPRNFSYIYPAIAGMSSPRSATDIDVLISMGFTHLLTLTEESPLPPSWTSMKRIEHIFIPIPNYGSPTLAEMDMIYDQVMSGGRWVVHCGGGVGRAGTVLACLIAMLGEMEESGIEERTSRPRLDAKEAIRLLRTARTRSLESQTQEDFVARWVSHRWKVSNDQTIVEPVTVLSHPPGFTSDRPLCLFLIGLPGSGKSWFSECLMKRRNTVVINQDDTRSRSACERALINNHSDDTHIILDRCNPSKSDRALWLKLLHGRDVIAVYFDYSKELCQMRISKRLNHPTIRAGQGRGAMDQMDKMMQQPELAEGFEEIIKIDSFHASRQAVSLFSSPPVILKFPRTPHLFNLGAMTSDDIHHDDGMLQWKGNMVIEEKIDGANMGISLSWDKAFIIQNRSHYIASNSHAQFKQLDKWIQTHEGALRTILDRDDCFPERFILYGEWVFAKHSILYPSLPDLFSAFGLYDRFTQKFFSRKVLEGLLENTGIYQVPLIKKTAVASKDELQALIETQSAYGDVTVEGVYVRFEDPEGVHTVGRGKVVRGDFIAGNEHWSKGNLTPNGIVRSYRDA